MNRKLDIKVHLFIITTFVVVSLKNLLIKSTMDALAVLTEEGRVLTCDNVGEAVNSLRSDGFRMG